MAATQTVHQIQNSDNSPKPTASFILPKHGVVTLFGYGISVHVDRGHLIFKDGIGMVRREGRFPRVRHGIRRLVVIGTDGMVSLAALRWLADQDAAFVMLDRNGTVLSVVGPVGPSDARLRRAQALAHHGETAVNIARELIARKLIGQEHVIRTKFGNSALADVILHSRIALAEAYSISSIRQIESRAASAYWSAWKQLPLKFSSADFRRVPIHWCSFGSRQSPLTGSPRLAANPANAILNYLYALLESEARLAAVALGLDPGLGVLHVDTDARDSLACDLMEAVRPQVDGYLLDWITQGPFSKRWFFEQRDGSCRLMSELAIRLSETTSTWACAVAPVAEWVAQKLWSTIRKPKHKVSLPTKLTENNRRRIKDDSSVTPITGTPSMPNACATCGVEIKNGDKYCVPCAAIVSKEEFVKGAQIGRIVSHTAQAEAKRGAAQKRQHRARRNWKRSELPDWLDGDAYRTRIQPALGKIPFRAVASALGISKPYATDIRAGRRVPHRRHWQSLARLVGILAAP